MDATATQLTDIKFNEAKKGYDPVEVDNFLEKLGDAVVRLQEKVREANRRAEEAERRASDAQRISNEAEKRALEAEARVAAGGGPGSEDELAETLKKTLLLAQRTADDTVKEAETTSAKLLDEAKQKAAKLLEDATRDSAKLLVAAEEELRVRRDAETGALEQQVVKLGRVREQLVGDIEAVEKHLELLRAKVREDVGQLIGVLDDPERLRAPDRPVLQAKVPEPAATPAPASSTASASRDADPSPGGAPADGGEGTRPGSRSATTSAAPVPIVPDSARPVPGPGPGPVASGAEPVTPPIPSRAAGDTTAAKPVAPSRPLRAAKPAGDARPAGDPTSTRAAVPAPAESAVAVDDAAPEASKGPDAPSDGDGPPTQAMSAIESNPTWSPDDGFLDELRKAVDDETPLGPADEQADAAMQAFFAENDEEELPQRGRFGRRR